MESSPPCHLCFCHGGESTAGHLRFGDFAEKQPECEKPTRRDEEQLVALDQIKKADIIYATLKKWPAASQGQIGTSINLKYFCSCTIFIFLFLYYIFFFLFYLIVLK